MNNSATHPEQVRGESLLYRWDDLVLSFSPLGKQLNAHYHGAAELIVGYRGVVRCNLHPSTSISGRSILIPAGTTHKNEYEDQLSVTMYFDSDSQFFRHLSNEMLSNAGVFFPLKNEAECQEEVRWIYQNEPTLDVCRERLNKTFIRKHRSTDHNIDSRIQIVLDELRKDPANKQPVNWFSEKIGLSEDRLHHLFTEVMGLPIHRYRIWLRLKRATQCYFSGFDLTYAAHEAGFSDAAHFSRTFKNMYGASPKAILSFRKHGRYHFS